MKKIILTAAILFFPLPAFAYLPSQLPHTHGVERTEISNAHPSRRTLVSAILERQTPPHKKEATTLATYHNDAFGLSLQYPQSWEMREHMLGTVVSFISPLEGSGDHIRENVNLVTQELPENAVTLESYSDGTLRALKTFNPSMFLIASEGTVVGGLSAHSITYEQDTGLGRIQFRQVWFLRGNEAFLFTFTAEPENFERYEKAFRTMLETMKIGA